MPKCGHQALAVMTSFCSTMSFLTLVVALSTNRWLVTEELIKPEVIKSEINASMHGLQKNATVEEFVSKYAYSGLWTICIAEPKSPYNCSYIDYNPKSKEIIDPSDATKAVVLAIRRSCIFPLISCFLLFIAGSLCFAGQISRKRKFLTFLAGIIFVFAGLCTFIGLVIYISNLVGEVGPKLRKKSTADKAPFNYQYGYSFILAVASLILTKLAGVSSVYFYIERHKREWKNDNERRKTKTCRGEERRLNPGRRHNYRSRSNSLSREHSGEHSPTTNTFGGRRTPLTPMSPISPLSESMKDMSYHTLSRDISRNTVSTTADICKEFSFDTLRRTTPV